MWFFMILCYTMTAVTFLALLLNGVQGYFLFPILNASHATFALLAVIIYLFTQTLIIFYFVGIGVSIKEYSIERKLTDEFQKRSLKVKRVVYPPILWNMLLIMVLFISGGAVDTKHLPGWLHGVLFWIGMIHFGKVIWVEHKAFQDSTAIVLDMSGIKR